MTQLPLVTQVIDCSAPAQHVVPAPHLPGVLAVPQASACHMSHGAAPLGPRLFTGQMWGLLVPAAQPPELAVDPVLLTSVPLG